MARPTAVRSRTAPFAPAEIARLEEQRLEALELRVQADLEAGRHAELVAELGSSRASTRCGRACMRS